MSAAWIERANDMERGETKGVDTSLKSLGVISLYRKVYQSTDYC